MAMRPVRIPSLLSLVMVASTITVVTTPTAARAWEPAAAQQQRSVPGTAVAPRSVPVPDSVTGKDWSPPAAVLPAATDAVVAVTATKARIGASPLTVGAPAGGGAAPERVRVQVLDRSVAAAAGVDGLLARLTSPGTGGTVSVDVDYSGFRSMYGGDWASRLHLVRMPGCVLTTPQLPRCQERAPLADRNDLAAGRISAEVTAPGTDAGKLPDADTDAGVVALAAANAGGGGDYKATSLAPSATWQVSTQTGAFTWSYPMRTPPVPGDLDVDLELSYSSGSIDGQIATTNNQTSWVGQGFALSPGFIERTYTSCVDDGVATKPGDLCWGGDYVSVSFGARATELIRDGASGQWRLREDDGTRVEHLTGAANGAQGGEYWKLTTTDGTQYFFGRHRLPGWVSGKAETNSTWTVPVFGDDGGEPCHQSTFAASWCQQAYRWNLDHVVDVHGNSLAHFYVKETNHYGRNITASAGTPYVRGGHLTRTEYGLRSGAEYSVPAPAMASYAVAERCLRSSTDCAEGNITAHPEYWPDVPADRICNAGAACTGKYSPTFFTRKRLTSVTTKVRTGTGYTDVESWELQHTFPASGDGLGPSLWLNKIVHKGLAGGTVTLPAVTFTGIALENRVDAAEGLAPMYKHRISSVLSETGGALSVNHSAKECARATNMPASPESNTKRCFPQYWLPEGQLNPIQDWFHKYVTTQVVAVDNTGGAPFDITTYEYVGGAAWHYDEEYMLPATRRTWSQWRGYQKVRVTRGDTAEQRSQTEHLFLRGMDGDTLPGGATRSVTVTDSEGGTVRDSWRLQGFERESIVYNGPGGAHVSGEIDDPWLSGATATQGSRQAQLMGTASERGRVALAAGGWRRTRQDTTFDGYGMPTTENDLGDVATAADDRCTRTTYARNTGIWLLDPVARTEEVSVACTATPSRPGDVISDVRSWFDNAAGFGTTPTKGDVTRTEELADWTTGPVYVTTGRSVHDAYGRVLDSYDAEDKRTTTAYTPAAGGPVTQTTVTDPLGHTTTTALNAAWGQPDATVDANGKRTSFSYDPLGRLTAVWLPGRDKATQSASMQFGYTIPTDAAGRVNGPVAVATRTLRNDGQYNVSYQLLDSLLRPRQAQAPAPGGGRVVTDTYYNSRGQVAKVNQEYYNAAAASGTLFAVSDNQVPGQTLTTYDGADRPTVEAFRVLGVERWRTTTTYGGDRVSVDPPAGATATTAITDARGLTTQLWQYTGGAPTGAHDTTTYTHTPDGQLETVTDPAGNVWRRHYDLRGRQVRTDDPDNGTSTKTYDDLDRVRTSTDARGKTVAYLYDALGRPTETRQDSQTGPLLTRQVYDTVAKGHPSSSVRYVGGNAYTTAVVGYTDLYQPTGTSVTIPAAEGALAGTYTTGVTYNLDGTAKTTTLPAVGGLAAETLTHGYNELGMLTTMSSGLGTYVNATTWSKLGGLLQRRYGNTGSRVVADFTFEEGTNRLLRAKTDLEQATNSTQSDLTYGYDPAGNITRLADTPPAGAAPPDTQCFRYDHLRRLTEAWTAASTATDACAAAPGLSVLGGPAPYWHSYTYDAVGNRRTETQHAVGGDVVRTFGYPVAGQRQPHTMTSLTEQSPTGTTTGAFGYDAAGNTTARPGQTLTWDAEGALASVTTGGGTTSFLYDGTGDRLIRRDPSHTTVYLGDTELRLAKASGVVTATRYYSDGSGTTAVRTYDNNLYWQVDDQNNTALMAIDASTLAVTRRRTTPFGGRRGPAVAWQGERGFVDGTVDAMIGLTQLGAREYDAATGRFLSVDPVIDPSDPQQMNGYAYANNSPVTFSDPDGLLANCGPDGFRCGMDPNTDRNTGKYIGPRPKPTPKAKRTPKATSSGSSSSRRPWYRQPDGGGYAPYRPASNPRAHRKYHQLPDGGYEPDRRTHYTPYRPARPKPKPSLWSRVRHAAAEYSGINAARRCIMDGSVSGCIEAAVTVASMVAPGSGIVLKVGTQLAKKAVARSVAKHGLSDHHSQLAATANRAAADLRRLQQSERGRPDYSKLERRVDPWGDEVQLEIGRPVVFPAEGYSSPSHWSTDIIKSVLKHGTGWQGP